MLSSTKDSSVNLCKNLFVNLLSNYILPMLGKFYSLHHSFIATTIFFGLVYIVVNNYFAVAFKL